MVGLVTVEVTFYRFQDKRKSAKLPRRIFKTRRQMSRQKFK